MNRSGVLQSSPVQQMMAPGNPNWWNINNLMRPPIISSPHHQQLPSPSSATTFLAPPCDDNNISNNNFFYNMNMPTPSSSSWLDDHPSNHNQQEVQQFPESWSQLLLGGALVEDQEAKKLDNWEEQVLFQQNHQNTSAMVDIKQESSSVDSCYNNTNQEFHHHLAAAAKLGTSNWSHHHHNPPISSPQSCVTTFSSSNNNTNTNNMLDFSSSVSSDNNLQSRHTRPQVPDRSSECNSAATSGGALKKAKVQPSSAQSTFKVRKEKLGDRVTALHQLVSPFGKTDTASVLLEAIGYVRFLHSQIEALSLPYLSSAAGNKRQPPQVPGERNSIFPEDPGQLLNDNCLKRKGGPDHQDSYEEPKKDLRSRGLCLIPVSCTLHVGSDNGADYWAPALGGGFR